MWLTSGDHSVLVSPQGGSILQWQWRDRFILGPTRVVRIGDNLKRRGETHWCYPNFGKPVEGTPWDDMYSQHGYLRDTQLGTAPNSGDSVAFHLTRTKGPEKVNVRTGVKVSSGGVSVFLTVRNMDEEKIPVLPGFHPYFAVPTKGLVVLINGTSLKNTDAGPKSKTLERRSQIAQVHLTGVGRVTILPGPACSHVVVWSDSPSQYTCVEPVFGEPGTFGRVGGHWLMPGDAMTYQLTFGFEPAV